MNETVRLLLSLALAGTAVTFLGSAAIWYLDEERRIRRALKRLLKAEPESLLVAKGRGRGVGLSFRTGMMVVAWDAGAWCLIYRIDELVGAELIVDGQVLARVFRGEPRRALDAVTAQAARVTLRLVFDDARYPDFDLDLWVAGDERRRVAASPAEAVQQANSWLARAEAILRRPLAPKTQPPAPPVALAASRPATPPPPPPPPPPPAEAAEPAPEPIFQARPAAAPAPQPHDEAPPWDDDDEPPKTKPKPASVQPRDLFDDFEDDER